MKKTITVFVLLISFFSAGIYAQTKKNASAIRNESLKQGGVQDSIDYLKSHLGECATKADQRSLLYFTGTMQEQLGLYTDASASYAKAAGIAAGDAAGMPRISSEELVIAAVRCCLCAGDHETADSYLASSVRQSKNENILALANLYGVWSSLCKASSISETKDSVVLLQAYSSMETMKSVRPQILFTLWYLTNNSTYSERLKKEFPDSAETAIVKGNIQIASVPFWYFVPRGKIEFEAPATSSVKIPEATDKSTVPSEVPSVTKDNSVPVLAGNADYERSKKSGKKQQLGLFKKRENAVELIEKARRKNFDAYYFTEVRSSGTKYYIVVVDENSSKTMGNKLKDAGFDCYTVE
ncbi:MAG: SPOR domain-containing protein [Treponema sp.]|nr:SPOR domain-containing protein [Treponema sp.]